MQDTSSLLWYLVRTQPKQEVRAEANLRSWNIETFAPKVREKRRVRVDGRSLFVDREAPLFPGYLFAKFDAVDRLNKVRMTRGVRSVVGFGECATPVDEEAIEAVRQRIDEDGFVRLEPPKPGDRVQIISGPLRSIEGIFERRSGHERVVILLSHMFLRLRVEVAREDIVRLAASS